ncbi:hypothetical protein CHS0354_037840 [Potamilus streckersoni]|uniref:RCR-type E3 ubiquitin transferase n=2 Tax=Potamilus streckersoni TaxID=2493646 RepID=A0AAE0SJ83_9BIVA|nr:hypothetical protein CHS0354_037840 [Potamilus streckersoni]
MATCRFCDNSLIIGQSTCYSSECQSFLATACTKVLKCGHRCGGIKDESECLPCLYWCTTSDMTVLKQRHDDVCVICFTSSISAAPSIQLACGHVLHLHCTKRVIAARWDGPRITFRFTLCPLCQKAMEHPLLTDILKPIRILYDEVKRMALTRLKYDGLQNTESISTPGAPFYQDPEGFSINKYAYYICFQCQKPYFGGEARCDEQDFVENHKKEDFVCARCSQSNSQICAKHGIDYLEYKCRYCCSMARFHCFGTTHFCDACHTNHTHLTQLPKDKLPRCPAGPVGKQLEGSACPLGISHPPTGDEFALGCGLCNDLMSF